MVFYGVGVNGDGVVNVVGDENGVVGGDVVVIVEFVD